MNVKSKPSLSVLWLAAMVLTACNHAAYSQAWPAKPIRMICAYTAGGSIDLTGRPVAQGLTDLLGQQVIYENRPGANGNLGAAAVAKAAPDGYTILIASVSQLTINPSLYADMPFNVGRDFSPITLIASTPNVLVVHPSIPSNTLKELLAFARAKPGALKYASAGNGSINHLAAELFRLQEKIDIIHVPFSGNAPALNAVLGGEVNMMITSIPPALPLIKGNRVKALAVAAAKRYRSLSELPTMAEAGTPGVEANAGIGLVVPAGTPRPIIDRYYSGTIKVINAPELREKLLLQGVELIGNSPDEFAAAIKEESARWEKVVRTANIKLD